MQTLFRSFLRQKGFLKFGSELVFVFLGQFTAVLGSLIGVRLITQYLSPTAYGEVSLALTAGVLFQQILFGPLSGAFLRFFSIATEKEQIHDFMEAVKRSSVRTIQISVLLLFFIMIFLLAKNWSRYISLVLFSFLFLLFSSLNSFLDNLQNAARHRIVVAWHQGVGSWARYILSILIILLFGASSTAAAAGFALSAFLIFLSQSMFLLKSKYFSGSLDTSISLINAKTYEKEFWSYAYPFMIWGIFTWALLSSDRWALSMYTTNADVGLYTVIYQLGYYPLTLFSGIFVQFISPILFQWTGDASEKLRVQRSTQFIQFLVLASLVGGGVITVLEIALHKEIFTIFVAPNYRQVSYLLPWMAMSGSFFSTGQLATMHFINRIIPQKLIIPKIATSILGIGLNFILGKLFGLTGIVISNLIFSTTYLIYMILLSSSNQNQ